MDPRVTWYQPEQLCRATDLWTQIFDSATEDLQNFHVGDSMSKVATGSPSPSTRNGAGTRPAQDYIPLNGELTSNARKKGANGFIFGDRQDTIYRKRKENLASTYDWNHSGRLRNGGTPWRDLPGRRGHRYSGIIGLHDEIIDFYKFMLPRHEEHLMRREVVHRISDIVRSIWPDAKVEIYGSYRTMLYLPTSDIDLVLFGDLGDCPYFRLGNELEKSGIAEQGSIKVLDKASVPIVKLTDDLTKVRVDISFNMRTGTDCAKLIEDFIVQYPSLPYLVFTLKQFLLQRDLNEVWTGGISSYSLILMIVSFLQLHAPPEPENLGVLLIEFFELYGNSFNYFKTGISVMEGGYYFSKEDAQKKMMQGYRTSLLCIEDPLNPGLDICKNSYGFMSVRQAFNYAYRVLCQAVLPHIDQEDDIDCILGRIIRVTDEVVAYRHWIHQNWHHKVPNIPPYIPSMQYLQMMSINQWHQRPDNTAVRLDNGAGNQVQQHHQQPPQQQQIQQHPNQKKRDNVITNNNNSPSDVRTSTPIPSPNCSPPPTSAPISNDEGGTDAPLAGQGITDEARCQMPPCERKDIHSASPTMITSLQKDDQQTQQNLQQHEQHSQENSSGLLLPTSGSEMDVNSSGTLSSRSSQDDLSSCCDGDSDHSSVSSKDITDSPVKDAMPPPSLPPQGRYKPIATATVTMKSVSPMSPSIIVSSSTSQRTATPSIIKTSAVLAICSSSTTDAITKPKSSTSETVTKAVVIANSVAKSETPRPVTPVSSSTPAATSSTKSTTPTSSTQSRSSKTTTTTQVTSSSQPTVTSRTYRNKSHQQSQQSSGKYRSSSASSSGSTSNNNNNASGGKRLKRKHKKDSHAAGR